MGNGPVHEGRRKGWLSSATALDGSARIDHPYLTEDDHCLCLAEYRSGSGVGAGRVSGLIANLKCLPSVMATDERRRYYKRRALNEVASVLRGALSRQYVEHATWVPIPPSKMVSDPDHDDRLPRLLKVAFDGYDIDLRQLLYQVQNTRPDHCSACRATAAALFEVIRFDRAVLKLRPLRSRIILFDDVLTTGKHYKCCERRLREAFIAIPISGLFVARRVLSRRWRVVS